MELGHNELWWSLASNSLCEASQYLGYYQHAQCRREIQLVYKIYIYFYRLYWYFYRLYWYCYVVSQRDTICGLSQPQFIVPEGQNIWEVTERLSLAFGHHNLLCLKVITFEKSQRGYLWPLATTVHCTRRPQHLRSHREAIYGPWPPQFIVPEGHNIWEVTEAICGICPPQFIVPEGHSIWEVTEAICDPWPPHFIVPKGHNIWKVTKRIFVVFAHHSSLCPNVTTFEKSQRGYLWSLPTTAHSARRPQHLRSHRESIWGLCPPQFIVAEGHNIWKITERLFLAFAHHSSSLIYATICVICLPQFIVPEGTSSKAFLLSPLPHPTSHHQHFNSWICEVLWCVRLMHLLPNCASHRVFGMRSQMQAASNSWFQSRCPTQCSLCPRRELRDFTRPRFLRNEKR